MDGDRNQHYAASFEESLPHCELKIELESCEKMITLSFMRPVGEGQEGHEVV